jgi:predicted dehydrogenase
MNHVEDRMIRIGIIGLGSMGAHHLKILAAMKKVNSLPNFKKNYHDHATR